MEMYLENIYSTDNRINQDKYYSLLYQLLAEREENESISHSGMPTFGQHVEFVSTKPYKGWYIITSDLGAGHVPVGSIYLSYNNEIGIAIFKKYRRKHYATEAIKMLMKVHSTEKFFIANINPLNEKSITLFEGLGYKLIQQTFRYKVKTDVIS